MPLCDGEAQSSTQKRPVPRRGFTGSHIGFTNQLKSQCNRQRLQPGDQLHLWRKFESARRIWHITNQSGTTLLCPPLGKEVIVMLERYYALPTTVDRIRALWLGPAIERYAAWLAERGFSGARGRGCIAVLIQFNRFAQAHGAQEWNSLPALVDSFVACRTRQRGRRRRGRRARQTLRSMFRSPIEQLLRLAIPGYVGTVRHLAWPFSASAPQRGCAFPVHCV
jgi:hypothetical protein